MGRHKLLLPWGSTTLIQHVLAAWRSSPIDRVVVVVRPDDDELARICRACSVDVVIPPVPPPEMKDSVQHALQFIQQHQRPQPADVWLLSPADMPRLSPAVIRRLLDSHRPSQPAILLPTIQGRRAHPVLFPWPLSQHVFQLSADQGVNSLLTRLAHRQIDCPGQPVPDDVDTPDDYRRLRHLPDGS